MRALVVPIFVVAATGTGLGAAQEPSSVAPLKERMEAVQDELNASILRIEELRADQDTLLLQMATTDLEIDAIERRNASLSDRSEAIARDLYMNGSDGTLEAWLGSENLSQVASRMEYVEAVGEMNAELLESFSESEAELRSKRAEFETKAAELTGVEEDLFAESAALQERFEEVSDEYETLRSKLEAKQRREAAAAREAAERAATASSSSGAARPGMVCPIDGAHSFIDSWGFPRSGGRTHEGADIFAALGTPAVAITDGEITYAGVGSLSGNWLILTGNDGHEYMYMHNQMNLVTSGRVRAGDQIATVGDTGNAVGTPPHVHFEYHPNAGGPVNPYSLLVDVC